jgi:hypothetical protein
VSASPERRFVRARHVRGPSSSTATTFLSATGDPPDLTCHGVLSSIAARDPEQAERIRTGLNHLITRDEEVMAWLEADPANTALFLHDPVAALRTALPDLDEDFFGRWSHC